MTPSTTNIWARRAARYAASTTNLAPSTSPTATNHLTLKAAAATHRIRSPIRAPRSPRPTPMQSTELAIIQHINTRNQSPSPSSTANTRMRRRANRRRSRNLRRKAGEEEAAVGHRLSRPMRTASVRMRVNLTTTRAGYRANRTSTNAAQLNCSCGRSSGSRYNCMPHHNQRLPHCPPLVPHLLHVVPACDVLSSPLFVPVSAAAFDRHSPIAITPLLPYQHRCPRPPPLPPDPLPSQAPSPLQQHPQHQLHSLLHQTPAKHPDPPARPESSSRTGPHSHPSPLRDGTMCVASEGLRGRASS